MSKNPASTNMEEGGRVLKRREVFSLAGGRGTKRSGVEMFRIIFYVLLDGGSKDSVPAVMSRSERV